MNPARADNIDEARRMQYEVFLTAALHQLEQTRTGLLHCTEMADRYQYRSYDEAVECVDLIDGAIDCLHDIFKAL